MGKYRRRRKSLPSLDLISSVTRQCMTKKERRIQKRNDFRKDLARHRARKTNALRDYYVTVHEDLLKRFLQVSGTIGVIVHVMIVAQEGAPELGYSTVESKQNHILLCKDIKGYQKHGTSFVPSTDVYDKSKDATIPWKRYYRKMEKYGSVRIKFTDESFITEVLNHYSPKSCILTYLYPPADLNCHWLKGIRSLFLNSFYGPHNESSCAFFDKIVANTCQLKHLCISNTSDWRETSVAEKEASLLVAHKETLEYIGISHELTDTQKEELAIYGNHISASARFESFHLCTTARSWYGVDFRIPSERALLSYQAYDDYFITKDNVVKVGSNYIDLTDDEFCDDPSDGEYAPENTL